MKVKTLIRFTDLKEKTIREIGDVFEVSNVRFAEISAASSKNLIEEVKEDNKTKKPSKKAGD